MNDYYFQYILYFLGFVVIMLAQAKMQGAYHKYRKIDSHYGFTAADVARKILDSNGLGNVHVQVSEGGMLSDHYNPLTRTATLSSDIYYKSSIASIAVAAHEVGHAIQHKEGYGAIAIRNKLLPVANIASQMGWGVLFIGFFLGLKPFLYLGILMLVVVALFQFITLPIEFNASSRALRQLQGLNIVDEDEVSEAKSMLNAAALTYVAALLSTIFQILRLLVLSRRNDD